MIKQSNSTIRIMVTGHRKYDHDYNANRRIELLVGFWLSSQLNRLNSYKTDLEIEAISGMALGADLNFADHAAGLSNIELVAALPFRYQSGYKRLRRQHTTPYYKRVSHRTWPLGAARAYFALLSKAKEIVEVDKVKGYAMPRVAPHSYHPAKFNIRNKWMVDYTLAGMNGVCLAIWSGRPGGTANCVALAKEAGLHVVQYWPTQHEIEHARMDALPREPESYDDLPF